MAIGRYGRFGGPVADLKAQMKTVEDNLVMLEARWSSAKSAGDTISANALENQIRQQRATLAQLWSNLQKQTPASAPNTAPPTVQPDVALATMPTWQKGLAALVVLGGLAFATRR